VCGKPAVALITSRHWAHCGFPTHRATPPHPAPAVVVVEAVAVVVVAVVAVVVAVVVVVVGVVGVT
jgi:hypothetical protein